MTTLVRTWLGIAALGAGLVHLAVAASAPPVQLTLLLTLGIAETAWGVVAFARARVPAPRVALGGAVLAVVGWLVVLVGDAGSMSHMAGMASASAGPSPLPASPMLGATVLDLVCAAGLAFVVRRGARPVGPTPGVWPYLGGVVAGAAVVAGITSASLGGTAVGAIGMAGMGH